MRLEEDRDLEAESEQLEEFEFLFKDLQKAPAIHPPRQILEEYARGLRPEGIDPEGWHAHAISAHLGFCRSCQLESIRLRRVRRLEQLLRLPLDAWKQFWQGTTRWRRAYQYIALLVLISGLLTAYFMLQSPVLPPEIPPGAPPPATESPVSGLARLH